MFYLEIKIIHNIKKVVISKTTVIWNYCVTFNIFKLGQPKLLRDKMEIA